jgi:serine/threonine protein phosphatase 1
MGNRTLVIGDIHGAALTFNRLLDVIEFERTDELYLLGDYIDRLDHSCGVIETILRLQRDGFQIRPILGNHEDMLLLAIRSGVFEDLLDWLENGGDATLKSYGVRHPQDIPEEHLQFFESLPLYRITDRFLFVHAGIDCSLADPFSASGRRHMLWDRSGIIDIGKLGGRRVVSGHSGRKLMDITKSLKKNHIRVDGCIYGNRDNGYGNLVAVDLDNLKLVAQPNIDG